MTGTLVLDAASVDTKHTRRDVNLRTAGFLDVMVLLTITCEATSGNLGELGNTEPHGSLKVRAVSRPLAVSANFRSARNAVTIWAEVEIDRSAWGFTSTSFGAGLKNTVFVRAQFERLTQR